MPKLPVRLAFLFIVLLPVAAGQITSTTLSSEPVVPYCPSLDLASMDKSVDPCVDFYHYACGGWQKKNPIPPDQTSWSVSTKLFQENLNFLHGILEQAAPTTGDRDKVTKEIGDFYAACMDETTVEKRGISAVQQELDAIAQVSSTADMATLVARLQLVYGESIIFGSGSMQDPDNSEQVIAELDQGGLGLPDRDYYTKEDAKSKETRERYIRHIQKVFELMGDNSETAKQNADTVMRMETALAKASITLVDRNDPYKLKHKIKVAELSQLAPNFDWPKYYLEAQYPGFEVLKKCRAQRLSRFFC